MKRLIKKIDKRFYDVGPFGFLVILTTLVVLTATAALIVTICDILTPFLNYIIWGIEY